MFAGCSGDIDLVSYFRTRICLGEHEDASGRVGDDDALFGHTRHQNIFDLHSLVLFSHRDISNHAFNLAGSGLIDNQRLGIESDAERN